MASRIGSRIDARRRLAASLVLGARLARYRTPLALAGALVASGQLVWWFSIGAWPPHDTAAIWLAGVHLREGAPVYGGVVGGFLAFLYMPPIAIIAAPLSLMPLGLASALLLAGQVIALRWIAGSWTMAGLLGWLPFVPRELVTGNVDIIMAAAIYAGARGIHGSGYAAALFALMKVSPVLVARRWSEFILASAVLMALTLPWLSLWAGWLTMVSRSLETPADTVPILPRLAICLALLIFWQVSRRTHPAALATAAALATPAFYLPHSFVLLLPAARLLWDQERNRPGRRLPTLAFARPAGPSTDSEAVVQP